MNTQELLHAQRAFFRTGITQEVGYRLFALRRLKAAVLRHRAEICAALYADLGKSKEESFLCEMALIVEEINHFQRHLKGYAAQQNVLPSLAQIPAHGHVQCVPYGTTLIISPWNYPFLLAVQPLCAALAAGNTAVIKPSEYAPHTARLLEQLLTHTFPAGLVTVVTGGQETAQDLLDQPFDMVFFTGSRRIAERIVMQTAKHLTPTVLELGGKSPCIVDETADIRRAARRIVFGKYLNAGQTCVAPDYVLVHASRKAELVQALRYEIRRQFGERPLENPAYVRIVNERHFDRLCTLLTDGRVLAGGQTHGLHIEPTVLDAVSLDSGIMREEIFGPILPVLTWEGWEQAVRIIARNPNPLACYYFARNTKRAKRRMRAFSFGGGCINDTIMHLASSSMPFGGVGASGMGSYHGKAGFEAFSHRQSIVQQGACELPLRYQPYRVWKSAVVGALFR